MLRSTKALRALRPGIQRRFFGAAAHDSYCGYTHPRRKQYHVIGYAYENGGPLVGHQPTGICSQYGSGNSPFNACPPGLGKEGKWDYDTMVAMAGTWIGNAFFEISNISLTSYCNRVESVSQWQS